MSMGGNQNVNLMQVESSIVVVTRGWEGAGGDGEMALNVFIGIVG
jgi:hypothetical protein